MLRLLPLLLLVICSCQTDAVRVRLVNATAFNVESAELSFGGPIEEIGFLAAGDDTRYFRFDGADDCDRTFTAELQSFGTVMEGPFLCGQPEPLLPGRYSLRLVFEEFVGAGGVAENGVFLRLVED